MKYILYEFRKLSGIKHLTIILIVSLFLNIILCAYLNKPDSSYLPAEMIKSFFTLYLTDSNRIEKEYNDIQEWNEEQSQIFHEQIRIGNYDYEVAIPENKYAPEGFSDFALFYEVFGRIDYINGHPSVINRYIDNAVTNLREFESSGSKIDSYIIKYQKEVIDKYLTVASETKIKFEYTRGWDIFFTYELSNIFIFVILSAASSAIFSEEKNTGVLSIIKTLKYGRTKTAVYKTLTIIIITCGVVLMFMLENFVVIGIMSSGYGSMNNSIQAYSILQSCPYVMSVWMYLIVFILIKFLVFSLFSLLIMLISLLIENNTVAFISGIVIMGVNLIISSLNGLINIFNLISFASVTKYFERYRAVNILSNVVSDLGVMVYFSFAVIIISFVLILFAYNKSGLSLKTKSVIRHNINLKFKSTIWHKRKFYSLSLFSFETYKILISSGMIIVIIVLFGTKIIISDREYSQQRQYSDSIYKEYMLCLEGEMTDEKRAYITDERQKINSIISQKKNMQSRYSSGDISYNEYRKYLSDYNYAFSRNEVFERIEYHALYIDDLSEKGIMASFVYDTGWEKLIFGDIDWSLYLMCIVVFSELFVMEYRSVISKSGFNQILRITRYGRAKTFICKLGVSVMITIILSILWNLIDVIILLSKYELPQIASPIQSIEMCQNFKFNISIRAFLVLLYSTRLLSSVILTLLMSSLSVIMKSTVPAMATCLVVTCLPHVMSAVGTDILKYLDFFNLMQGASYLIEITTEMWYALTIVGICVGLVICAGRIWCAK